MEISTDKYKIMAFCGKDSVPSKICIDKKIIERVNQFNYSGCKISFSTELDILDKITNGDLCNYNLPKIPRKDLTGRGNKWTVNERVDWINN